MTRRSSYQRKCCEGNLTNSVISKHTSLRNALAHNAERLFWVTALATLFVTDPGAPPAIELCLWKVVGVEACPGCGLGRGIAHLLDGHFGAAIASHPLSPFALAAIAGRIFNGNRQTT